MDAANDDAEVADQTTLKVVIRLRPLSKKEVENGHKNVWSVDAGNGRIKLLTDKSGKTFTFDRIYSPRNSTKDIYMESMSPVIQKFVEGFNGTIFAYGQTSSGKTYTMMGSGKHDGVIHRAIKSVYSGIRKAANRQFAMKMSYLEIYNESIKDLLDPKQVDLKISMDELHRPYVRNLTTKCPANHTETFNILKQAMANRNIGATKLNDQSSRSHTIFQIHLESREVRTLNTNANDEQGENMGMSTVRSSVLNIVDLAGSERAKKTEAKGVRLKEAGSINTSLLTLGIVIRKLSEITKGKNTSDHIPYRDSKLTHILEPALGGNSQTVVICTMTPSDVHSEESLSTLGFASRAKEVKNCASVVEMRNDAELIVFQKQQIQQLQQKLFQLRDERHMGSAAIEQSQNDGDDEHGNHNYNIVSSMMIAGERQRESLD